MGFQALSFKCSPEGGPEKFKQTFLNFQPSYTSKRETWLRKQFLRETHIAVASDTFPKNIRDYL